MTKYRYRDFVKKQWKNAAVYGKILSEERQRGVPWERRTRISIKSNISLLAFVLLNSLRFKEDYAYG